MWPNITETNHLVFACLTGLVVQATGLVNAAPHVWHGGVVVTASDLQPIGGRFESQPLRFT